MTTPMVTRDAATFPDAMAPEWIACHQTIHSVGGGVVICPEGSLSPWAHCLSCRHLEAADNDRHPERTCSSEAAAAPVVEDRFEQPLESWGALIIELL
jgi:hypothetical protein